MFVSTLWRHRLEELFQSENGIHNRKIHILVLKPSYRSYETQILILTATDRGSDRYEIDQSGFSAVSALSATMPDGAIPFPRRENFRGSTRREATVSVQMAVRRLNFRFSAP